MPSRRQVCVQNSVRRQRRPVRHLGHSAPLPGAVLGFTSSISVQTLLDSTLVEGSSALIQNLKATIRMDRIAVIINQSDATTTSDEDDWGPVLNTECDMEVDEWGGSPRWGESEDFRLIDDDVYLIQFT